MAVVCFACTAWGGGGERALPILASFASTAQQAASACEADVVLLDVGPNLGAVNRAALVAVDHVVVPLSTDHYSVQGLRSLGPASRAWRRAWTDRQQQADGRWVPEGRMRPAGYVVLQRAKGVDRVVGD